MLVPDDAYLLSLVRYIHLNPVKAGLAEKPEQYPWSSHRSYCGKQQLEWVTTRAILSCFAGSELTARRQYQKFMKADYNWLPGCEETVNDQQDGLLMTNELNMQERLHKTRSETARILEGLVQEYCAAYGLSPAALSRPGRQRCSARVRALISHHAISSGIATPKELAVYFHRAPAVIARGIKRYCGDQSS
jgi:hypothetical protein